MAWLTWCNTHDAAWYLEETVCEDAFSLKECAGQAFVATKIGFDNKLELDIHPIEREDISAWLKKTKTST